MLKTLLVAARWLRPAPPKPACNYEHDSLLMPSAAVLDPETVLLSTTVVGASTGWGGEMTRVLDQQWRCGKCGETFWRRGVYRPDDQQANPHLYAADGWPLDEETFQRLPLYDDGR